MPYGITLDSHKGLYIKIQMYQRSERFTTDLIWWNSFSLVLLFHNDDVYTLIGVYV